MSSSRRPRVTSDHSRPHPLGPGGPGHRVELGRTEQARPGQAVVPRRAREGQAAGGSSEAGGRPAAPAARSRPADPIGSGGRRCAAGRAARSRQRLVADGAVLRSGHPVRAVHAEPAKPWGVLPTDLVAVRMSQHLRPAPGPRLPSPRPKVPPPGRGGAVRPGGTCAGVPLRGRGGGGLPPPPRRDRTLDVHPYVSAARQCYTAMSMALVQRHVTTRRGRPAAAPSSRPHPAPHAAS
jgi:hypothetical protein